MDAYLSKEVIWWLVAGSIAMFVGSLLAVPAIIVRLPADYFCYEARHRARPQGSVRSIYWVWLVAKNIAGLIFILAGMAMLVLPGQGLISILLGLSLTNFPGKYRLERFLISRPAILRSVNWIRRKADKDPLII